MHQVCILKRCVGKGAMEMLSLVLCIWCFYAAPSAWFESKHWLDFKISDAFTVSLVLSIRTSPDCRKKVPFTVLCVHQATSSKPHTYPWRPSLFDPAISRWLLPEKNPKMQKSKISLWSIKKLNNQLWSSIDLLVSSDNHQSICVSFSA